MQSGFPTADLPRTANPAASVDRGPANDRAAERNHSGEDGRDSAFSDMVAANRANEDTPPVRKPATGSKSGGQADAKATAETAPTGDGRGEAPARAGQTGTGTDPTQTGQTNGKTAESGTQSASAQSAGAQSQVQSQTQAAPSTSPAGPADAQSAQQAAPANPGDTGQTTARTSAEAATDVDATTRSSATAQTASTSSTTREANTPASGDGQAGTKAAEMPTGSDAAPKAATAVASGTEPRPNASQANPQAAGAAQTASTAPNAALPAAAQGGQATAQTATAQAASNGKPQSSAKTATGTAGAPAPDAAKAAETAPLRDEPKTRAILESSGVNAASAQRSRKSGASQSGQTNTAAQPSATPAPTPDAKPDTSAQLPRDTAPGVQSPQLQAQQAGISSVTHDTGHTLQTTGDADAAQADAEIQLNRTADVRAGVDRASGNLPRFAPHTAQQLAGQITRNFNNGQRVFDIRLDPAELGKVDVRLELRADNRVHAVLTAERPETLSELQRAARDLERSLNDAGLELAEDGLSFQMSDDGEASGSPDDRADDRADGGTTLPIFADGGDSGLTGDTATPIVQQSRYGFLLTRREGVDMRV